METTSEQIEIVQQALAQYGAELTPEGYIKRGDKTSSVRAVVKGKRLRFEGRNSIDDFHLIASGPITAQFVEGFVEKFWFWTKQPSSR